MLTPKEQIAEINLDFNDVNHEKFMAGQEEHGGDFFSKPTVDNIGEEVIDLVNYVHVLKRHREELLILVHEGLCWENEDHINDLLNNIKTKLEQL